MRRTGHAARMGEQINAFRIPVWNLKKTDIWKT
jgi:hypothetical protein